MRSSVLPAEKLIATLSYFTFGTVGFVWILLGAFLKQNLRPFLKYHIYQSIFLAVLFFIVTQALIFIVNVLAYIPYLNAILGLSAYLLNVSILNVAWIHLSIVQISVFMLIVYLSAGVVKGQYSYIPWVSDIIKYNID